MRVYLINLDRASDRLAHMQRQFEHLGISFVRVAAVDAALLAEEELKPFRTAVTQAHGAKTTWARAPEIAIFLSHKKVWSEIASGSDTYAAVFEDDVHFSDRIAPLLCSVDWIPQSADIVRLETTLQAMSLARDPFCRIGETGVFTVHSGAWGTAGYVIKREIAEWLASSPARIYQPADWFLFHALAPALRVLQLDPAPCIQDQYHPDAAFRRNFAKRTENPSGWRHSLANAVNRALSPLARRLTGRRGIPFA